MTNNNERAVAARFSTINALLQNPVTAGYLLIFCQSQFNAENVSFIMEVDDFRDQFLCDGELWDNTPPSSSSSSSSSDGPEAPWPSGADRVTVECGMKEIYNRYLSDDSSTQVASSKEIQQRTRQRMQLVHLYGPSVFEEACLDPIKTMTKDILPRFLQSNIYRRMVEDVATCDPPPPAADLKVPPPGSRLLTSASLDHFYDSRRFTLDEIISCLQLYNVFLAFLRRRVCAENLICVRMIAIFQEQMRAGDTVDGQRTALNIYRYFVAPRSAFEVSLHHGKRKQVMYDIAQPKINTFDYVQRSTHEQLKVHFDQFAQTPEYAQLSEMMRMAKLELSEIQYGSNGGGTASGASCFGVGR